MMAVSRLSMNLLPQKEAVKTDLHPFKQETEPLAKIWCVKMEDDTHHADELYSHFRIMKTYLKARYRLSDLLRAQRSDRRTSILKTPDKGDLEEDRYRILRQYYMQKDGRIYLSDGSWLAKGERRTRYCTSTTR